MPRKNFRYLVDRKEPTDDDPSWYNLYSDGWLEQGGTGQITTNIIIKLPISYRDILYTANANVSDESDARETGAEMAVGFKTTDSFTIAVSDGYGGTQKTNWITSGYANEDFVPKNNIHLYMVVGNVPIKKAIGEYTEVTTSENDTLPLFTGINFNFTPNHISWVKAGRISNANEYETAFNELVNCLNNNIYDLKIIEENQKDGNTNYDAYWIVNQEERTFRPPLQLGKLPDTGLYFKVDNAVKDLEMLNAGKLFENCVRKHELIPAECVTDTYTNGTSGYRVWSDGYCEQWGLTSNLTANTWYDVQLLKEYKDKFYSIVNTCNIATDFSTVIGCYINWDTITPASFQLKSSNTPTAYWRTSGYLSEGEY